MDALFLILACILPPVYASPISHSATGGHCRVTPTSPSWPSPSDWAQFNQTLGGALLAPGAPAEACHPDHVAFNTQACAKLQANWNSSQWHSDNPISSLWQNVNDYSCLPASITPCSTSGYPVFVVNASTPNHVKAAVDYARERRLRLNIKSTGHDFLGSVCLLAVLEIAPRSDSANIAQAFGTTKIDVDMDTLSP